MSAASIVAALAHEGVQLYLDGERLKFRAAEGAYKPHMRQLVAEHKPAILAHLASEVSDAPVLPIGDTEPVSTRVDEQPAKPANLPVSVSETPPIGGVSAPQAEPIGSAPEQPRAPEQIAPTAAVPLPVRKASKAPGGWTAYDDTLAAWLASLDLVALPAAPFVLKPGVTVLGGEVWLARLKADASQGRHNPRARFGALQDDMRALAALVGGPTP